MKWFKRIALSLILLIVLLSLGLYLYLHTFKPSYSGELKLQGLQNPTEVYFDNYGIPHIYGKSEADVFQTLGYIHAQERLFQIELVRRVSSGRLSELFGNSVLDVDKFFRMLGVNEQAKTAAAEFAKHSDEPWNIAATAYLKGLNQYIESGKLPLEFTLLGIPAEKYEIKDLYLVVSYVSFNFQMAFRTDPLLDRINKKWGLQYLVDLGFDSTEFQRNTDTIGVALNAFSQDNLLNSFESIQSKLPLEIWNGSNSMLVSAEKSSSGKALFENDTHIGQQQPSVWYESHLECPGFRFYGSSIAGFPFAALGHSERHAWGMTIFENDDLDFFREQANPDNPDQVWQKDHWENLKLRKETIKVKDSADVIISCRSSEHGPICSDVMKDFADYADPISACWTFLREPNNMMEVTYGLAHAKSMDEFKSYLPKLAAPGLNVLYADRENNIAWWAVAKIVKRPEHAQTSFVVDGSTGANDWLGYYDFELNPSSVNPEKGYIFSCNQTPQAVNGQVYPGYYLPDDRADRLSELMAAKEIFSINDLRSFCLDVKNPVTEEACKILMKHLLVKDLREGSPEKIIIDKMNNWNGEHELKDIAPSFYYCWYYNIYKNTFADEIGLTDANLLLKTHFQKKSILPWLNNDSSAWWDNIETKDTIESMDSIVTVSFREAFNQLTAIYGPNPTTWTWGKLHTLELIHPIGKQKPLNLLFNVGPYPIAGGIETLNNQSFEFSNLPVFKSNLGAAVRRTIDFADPENGMSVIPGGQSGNPMSPHYHDQTELYVSGGLRKEMMNVDEIRATCKNKLVFVPAAK